MPDVETELYWQTAEWCDELRSSYEIDDVVEKIEMRLSQAENSIERKTLQEYLCRSLQEADRYDDALAVMMKLHEAFPTDPLTSLRVAEHYLYGTDSPSKALDWIAKAEQAARQSGNFLRHVLATKARLALRLDNYTMLDDCLRKIASLRLAHDARDIRRERDFFDRADKSRLSLTAIQEYESYLSADVSFLRRSE